jgi:transcription antitermination protein NusB
MTVRRKAREVALQALYQLDIGQGNLEEVLALYGDHFRSSEKVQEFGQRLIHGVKNYQEEIDRVLEENSEHWTLKRMAAIDRNILRMAAFELLYCPDIPFKVTLNEAIELAKKFSTEESSAFINGILDQIHARKDSLPNLSSTLAPNP